MSNDLYQLLGKLQSDIEYIRKATDEGNGKIDTLTKTSVVHGETIKAAHKRLDAIEPEVQDYVNTKNKSLGVMTALSLFFTGIGYLISKLY